MAVPAPLLEEEKRKIEKLETRMKNPQTPSPSSIRLGRSGLTLRQAATGAWRFLYR
jgi:hypothetical protein